MYVLPMEFVPIVLKNISRSLNPEHRIISNFKRAVKVKNLPYS
jgi:hypothetical protein